MNDSQATPRISGTNDIGKSFEETMKKKLSEKNNKGESPFSIIRNIVR